MTEEKFWLMNHVPVVIAIDFKNPLKNVHDMFTIFTAKINLKKFDNNGNFTL